MKVIATRLGYYNHKRRYPADSNHATAGQPFSLKDPKHFSGKWMKKVDGDKPLPALKDRSDAREPAALSQTTGKPKTAVEFLKGNKQPEQSTEPVLEGPGEAGTGPTGDSEVI